MLVVLDCIFDNQILSTYIVCLKLVWLFVIVSKLQLFSLLHWCCYCWWFGCSWCCFRCCSWCCLCSWFTVAQFVGGGICCYLFVIQCYCWSDCKLEIPCRLGISSCPLRAPGVYLDSRALFVFLRSDWYPHLAPEFGYHEARDIKWINGYRMSDQL